MDKKESQELTVAAKVDNLAAVNEFVELMLAGKEYSIRHKFQLDLVVEEIFVNIANYAYGDKEGMATIKASLLAEPLSLQLQFIDGGTPYNPLETKGPDLTAGLEERTIGGLGIFLVKKNVDEISYQYAEGKNILSITKVMQE